MHTIFYNPVSVFKSVSLVIHCSLFYADKLQNMAQQRFKWTLTGMQRTNRTACYRPLQAMCKTCGLTVR